MPTSGISSTGRRRPTTLNGSIVTTPPLDQTEVASATPAKRGRRPATGRFATRAELLEWIWRNYLHTPATPADIARQCRVSSTVVNKILNTKEGRDAVGLT